MMDRKRKKEIAVLGIVIWLSVIMTGIFAEPIRDIAARGDLEGLIIVGAILLVWIFAPLLIFIYVLDWVEGRHQRSKHDILYWLVAAFYFGAASFLALSIYFFNLDNNMKIAIGSLALSFLGLGFAIRVFASTEKKLNDIDKKLDKIGENKNRHQT